MTRALVIYCHPLTESFTEAMHAKVLTGLERTGAEVRQTDLYVDGFMPAYTALDYANHVTDTIDQTLAPAVADLDWCNTLILVYPTWWSGHPSMLTGWIDRVWAGDAAHRHYGPTASLMPRWANIRRVVAVTSHGSTKLINMLEGETGRAILTRVMRGSCHQQVRTSWIALYGIDSSTLAQREAFLRKVERRISNLR